MDLQEKKRRSRVSNELSALRGLGVTFSEHSMFGPCTILQPFQLYTFRSL